MIQAIFKKKNNNIVSFNIEGHAGYAEEGSDIVCAAVSAIALTTVNGILGVLHIEVNPTVKDGFLNLNIAKLSDEKIEACQILLKTMLLGLKNVEIEYGTHIMVKEEEV